MDEPTGGTVTLNGEDYRAIAPKELRRRIGMVMQTAHLFPGTVGANVAFGPRQCGTDLSAEQIDALLERLACRITAIATSAIFRAARRSASHWPARNQTPRALLLDEPTSALDEASARGIEDLLLDIVHERHMTCVIVTHNRAQAARIATHAMKLAAGRLVAIGPAKEVLDAE